MVLRESTLPNSCNKMPKQRSSLVYMIFIPFLCKNIKRLIINSVALTVFAHGSLSKAQDMPSAPEMRNLALAGAFGAYYCRVFQGKPESYISEYWANIRALLGVTDQESSDPLLDSIGRYIGKRKISLAPGCSWREHGYSESIYEVLLEEWARQNPAVAVISRLFMKPLESSLYLAPNGFIVYTLHICFGAQCQPRHGKSPSLIKASAKGCNSLLLSSQLRYKPQSGALLSIYKTLFVT